MSVLDRSDARPMELSALAAVGAFCVAWDVPARAILEPRVQAWLRERLAAGYDKADVRVCWRICAHDACELVVQAGQDSMRVVATAPATLDTWREQNRVVTCASVHDAFSVTMLHEGGSTRLLYARTRWTDLLVEGGRYDVAEMVA